MGIPTRRLVVLASCSALVAACAFVPSATGQLLPRGPQIEIDPSRVLGGGAMEAVENATGLDLPNVGPERGGSSAQPLPPPTSQPAAPLPAQPPSGGGGSPAGGGGGGSSGPSPAAPTSDGAPTHTAAARASAGAGGGGSGAGASSSPAPVASERRDDTTPSSQGGGERNADGDRAPRERTPVIQFLGDVDSIPWFVFALIAVLALIGIVMAGRSAVLARVSRRLHLQRRELREDVGALQAALLPQVPERIGDVEVSVAYRPKDGPAAGGDFHDVVPIAGDKVAIVVGDVSGHGREALTITALAHYTVRAYLEAGLEPREAMRLADDALGGKLGEDFVTALAAVYDPETSTLTYATAGHPAPIVSGPDAGPAGTSVPILTPPPIGVGPRTGYRQTAISVPAASSVCLFTDGLLEARVDDGDLLERDGVEGIAAELGDELSAPALLERAAGAATIADDVTACVLRPGAASGDGSVVEELELAGAPSICDRLEPFLTAFGMAEHERENAVAECRRAAERSDSARLVVRRETDGTATWRVVIGGGAGALAAGPRPAGIAS